MTTQQKKKIPVAALIFFGAVDLILFVFAIPFIFELLGVNTKTPIHDILKGNEPLSAFAFFAWIAFIFAFGVFVIVFSTSSGRVYYRWTNFAENIFENLKIIFTKKSNFFGTSYEGDYLGLKITCKLHPGGEDSPNYVTIQIDLPRKLNLGLIIRNKGGVSLLSGEGKDIFAKTIKPADPFFESIDIFAKKKEEVENMLYSVKITEPLRKLTAILPNLGIKPAGSLQKFLGGLSGFYLNDGYISIRIEESLIKQENVKYIEDMIIAAADLSRAVSENAPII